MRAGPNRSLSAKVHADGAGVAAGEEADASVLMIAATMNVLNASSNQWKLRQKSKVSSGRKRQNRKAARNNSKDGRNMAVLTTPVRARDMSILALIINSMSRYCCLANPFPSISRVAHSLQRQRRHKPQ